MSSKKRKKLVHLAHESDDEFDARKFERSSKRGTKKFCVTTVDIENIIDWECDNYDLIYK